MGIEEIRKILVVGSGAMGSQIAMVCALAGYEVALQDISQESLQKAEESLKGHMRRRVDKGRLTQAQVEEAFARLTFSENLEQAARDADFVIEAIIEKLEVKRQLFAELDRLTPAHAILATNSSTIVSSKVADATKRPEKVCNMHFFNPALVMELVEVVRNPHTSQETVDITVELTRKIGKIPIVLHKEISGFVANRILGAMMDEAVSLYEQGIASFEDIDLACLKALNHPIGPFALMDLTGIDVNYYVRMQRMEETGDPQAGPKKSVIEKFKKGEWGRKTGKGWYDYTEQAKSTSRSEATEAPDRTKGDR
ncbi:3-hydroxyacyl-CoA dehydrogenase family protein [Effusibacillus lacus]|uniref:3-hydroxyacyl-CoA dehydrogenase n=1 Tax=Effusibacillus lacus TaxID=1348429 RepID=A0A292YNU5_9BACL|nr:3-hydroxyacyl-CoA dehydrogenase family protein [Effusibacillus lacus]TCS71650.1 3-hydroxybutyryl-CoA dehydrogenase [Effusibacillus lacus]GAX90155.1 3-hydroxyacyl-CoA dehydrogenase [Effusibacillus lacus]